MGELDGQVALVTGSTRGIGWAVARALAGAGASVVVNGRADAALVDARAAELRAAHGVDTLALPFDVADPAAVRSAARAVFERFGRLDVAVANAGMLGDGLIGMIGDDLVARTLDVNLAGAIHTVQAAAKLMRRARRGSIVLMSSVMGRRGSAGSLVYAASKAGVIGVGLSAAKELGPQGIRVNVVAPGMIDTELMDVVPPDRLAQRLATVPLGRLGTADEVAEVVRFLASDRAAYVTGQVLGVDGAMAL